jgi:hypothetical protein
MKRKVLITKAPLPKAISGLYTKQKLTNNAFQFPISFKEGMEPNLEVHKNIGPVDRDQANIEAEKGETILTPMGDDAWTKTLPKTYVIGGKKHSKGGTPLNVPEGSFIFSDHLKERNQKIHEMLGKAARKSGYTYAELSKPFMLNDDIRVLLDPDSDKITRETAQMNIQNKVDKLGLISILQEASKGFIDDMGEIDIPSVGVPYLEKAGINIEESIEPFLQAIRQPVQQQNQMPQQGMSPDMMPQQGEAPMPPMPTGRNGGLVRMKAGGAVKQYQNAGTVNAGLKAGERARYNTGTGKYEVVNEQGTVVGYIDFPGDRGVKVSRSKIPANAVILSKDQYEANKDAAYKTAAGKPLVIKNPDGSYKLISETSVKLPEYKESDLATIFANQADIASQYKYIQETFNNPKVKAELSKRALAALDESSNRGISLSSAEIRALKEKLKDPEYAYKMFMDMQRRNLSTYANQKAGNIKTIASHKDAADPGAVTNADFTDSWSKIGLNAPSAEEAKMQQALYIGYKDMLDNRDNLSDPELKNTLKPFGIAQVGATDAADLSGTGSGKISIIDGKYTNTTTGEIVGLKPPTELTEGDLGLEDSMYTPSKKREYVGSNIRKGWTAPDIYELARATGERFADRANMPFEAMPPTILPNVALLSPQDQQRNFRGMANAAGEQMLASGMTPQTISALSSLSGADQMAQYTAQVHNANVGILNEAGRDRANRLQKGADDRANLTTRLFDKVTQMKENLQARRSAAKAEVSKQFGIGESNEGAFQAAALSAPNFIWDPFTQDYAGFIPGADIEPTYGKTTNLKDRFMDYRSQMPANVTDQVVMQIAKADLGIQDKPDYLNYNTGIPG